MWVALTLSVGGILVMVVMYPTKTQQSTYTDPTHQFTLKLPRGITADGFSDEAGKTVIMKDTKGEVVGQVYLSSASDIAVLTPEFLRSVMVEQTFDMTSYGMIDHQDIPAVSFSFEPGGSRYSSEIWFVHGGFLYQWTLAGHARDVLLPIINSIQW